MSNQSRRTLTLASMSRNSISRISYNRGEQLDTEGSRAINLRGGGRGAASRAAALRNQQPAFLLTAAPKRRAAGALIIEQGRSLQKRASSDQYLINPNGAGWLRTARIRTGLPPTRRPAAAASLLHVGPASRGCCRLQNQAHQGA